MMHRFILLLLLLLALILSTYNLEYYPQTWFDEGWYLQIPKNLVQYGEYATLSSEGFRPFDTVVGVSLVFYLPIAAAFKIWGVGLLQARIVMVAYFLLTGLLIYAVAQRLYGPGSALVALALFILVKADDNFTSAVLMGRQVMGEIPALCFFMAATYFWLKSFERRTNGFLVLAGILLGVAMKTKGQFLLVVPPTLVALCAIDRLYYGQRRYRYFVLPLVMSFVIVVLQYSFTFVMIGADSFSRYLAEFFAASGPQVRVFFSPVTMQTALKFFLHSHYFIWVVPGLVYAVLLCATREPENIKLCLPWVFVAGWLTWFLVASVGWARYAFPALAVSYMLVAKLLDDLIGVSDLSLRKVWTVLRSWDVAPIARPMSVLLLIIMLLLNSSREVIKGIFSTPDRSAQQFAAYIDGHIEEDALIETWEWEIAFLTNDHSYHHPPTSLLNALIAHKNLGAPYDPGVYDFQEYGPAYIVVGSFAKWTGLYPPDFLKQQCTLVQSTGEYDLYRVKAREND